MIACRQIEERQHEQQHPNGAARTCPITPIMSIAEAFNHAFEAYTADPRQDEVAHRIAWAAVKRSYIKVGDK